jgi:hypothetical protein
VCVCVCVCVCVWQLRNPSYFIRAMVNEERFVQMKQGINVIKSQSNEQQAINLEEYNIVYQVDPNETPTPTPQQNPHLTPHGAHTLSPNPYAPKPHRLNPLSSFSFSEPPALLYFLGGARASRSAAACRPRDRTLR